MRAGGGYGLQVRARLRSGIYNAQQRRGAIGKVVTVARIKADFVGPALALKVSDDGPGLMLMISPQELASW
jgi:hypothetical protein